MSVDYVNVLEGYRPVAWARGLNGFHRCPRKYRGVKGGYRSGKTFAVSKEIIRHATAVGNRRWLIGRYNYTDLKETALRTFQAALEPAKAIVVRPFHHEDRNIILRCADGGQSEIMFKTLQEPESLGSLELTGFFMCEASECREAVYKKLQTRLNFGPGPHLGIVDFNPTSKLSWLYERFAKFKTENTALFTAPTYDNRENLPPGYIEALEAENDSEWISRYLHGDWGFTGSGSPVYPIFRRAHHVHSFKPLQDVPLVVGWDFGFRRPAAVIGQMQGGVLVILRAILGHDQTIDAFADQVMAVCNTLSTAGSEHYGDIAGSQSSQIDGDSVISRLGLRGIHIRTRAQKIHDGLGVVRSRLERRAGQHFGLMFDDNCDEIMLECMAGGYHFPEIKPDKPYGATDAAGDPLPFKDGIYDHLADALRYLCVGLFGIVGNLGEEPPVAAVFQRQAMQRGTEGVWY